MEALNYSEYSRHCKSGQLHARLSGSTKTPAPSQICEPIPPPFDAQLHILEIMA